MMVPTSLAHRYLRALLADAKATVEEVRERAMQEGIDLPDAPEEAEEGKTKDDEGRDYLSRILRSLPPKPREYTPWDDTHVPSQRYLLRAKVYEYFHPPAAMREAKAIFSQPRTREFVEALLLTSAPLPRIVSAMQRFNGQQLSVEGLSRFRAYYWDVESLSQAAVRYLLNLRHQRIVARGVGDSTPERKAHAAAARNVYYQDPRKVAADLPSSPVAAMLVQMRMGLPPAKVEMSERIEAARNLAVLRAEEALYVNGPGDAKRVSELATAAKTFSEMLESIQSPSALLEKEFARFQLQVDTKPLPSILSLTRGAHTIDVAPVVVEEDKE
jgi:hypothetical protein